MKPVFRTLTSLVDRVTDKTSSTELYMEQKLVLLDVGFASVSSALMTSQGGVGLITCEWTLDGKMAPWWQSCGFVVRCAAPFCCATALSGPW